MKKFVSKKSAVVAFMALCVSFNISAFADSISELNDKRENLKNQTEKTKGSLDETKKEKSDVLKEVERLDNELISVQKEINELNSKLEETKQELAKSQEDLEKASKDKKNQINIFKKRIRVMYESGNQGYLEIILESKDFSDFLKRLEYTDKIIEFDQNVIEEFEATEKRIKDNIENIKVKKEEIERLSDEEVAKKEILDKRIEEKEVLFEKLSDDEKKYLQELQNLENSDEQIRLLIQKEQARLAEKRKAAAEKAAREKAAAEKAARERAKSQSNVKSNNIVSPKTVPTPIQSPLDNNNNNNNSDNNQNNDNNANPDSNKETEEHENSSGGGKMLYPVPAYSGAQPTENYGYRVNPISGENELHTGVDLKADMNADVVAAAGGTVIVAGQRSGYGNTVIVDHGDGTSTLYAHNTSLNVSVGDEVKRGQVIAKAGTTGYSTGVHLHFEVRVNGMAVDPMPYLR